MDSPAFLTGLNGLQTRLIDLCRSMAENERTFVNTKDLLRNLALNDWRFDEADFEEECEELASVVEPIDCYESESVGLAYRVMLRMGLPWRNRYPLFDLAGMMGDLHDEMPFGPESVEVRLSKYARVLLPAVHQPRLPLALLNGVSLADGAEVPPHNLEELWMAMEQVRQDPDLRLSDLMEVIPGPDFGSGGVVGGLAAIRELYEKGEAALTLRGRIETEIEGGRTRVAVTSLPHGVLLKEILEQIEALRAKDLFPLYDFKNASGKTGVRLVFDVSPKVPAGRLKEILYRETSLERTPRFRCGYGDPSNGGGEGPLVAVLKAAVSQCSAAWVRRDGKALREIPLLRDIIRFGLYKNPLSTLTDARRTCILEIDAT
ncbi:MAG: DNA gyrase subunit A [Nitrospiria bacterium]